MADPGAGGPEPTGRARFQGLLLRRAFADQVANDHKTGGDPDPRLQLDGFDLEATDAADQAEIGQDGVAHVFDDGRPDGGRYGCAILSRC